jgi:PAP2 superfamily
MSHLRMKDALPARSGRRLAGVILAGATSLASLAASAAEPLPSSAGAALTVTPASAVPSATAAPPASAAPAAPSASPALRPVATIRRPHTESTPPSAFNPTTNKVRWNPHWPKFRPWEYVVTGVMGVTLFAALAIPPAPDRWRDVPSFDAEARNIFRLDSPAARNTIRDGSDLLLALMINHLVVDAALVAWWGHDRSSVAEQMVLIDLETMAVAGGIQAIVSGVASRWRPYRDTCVGPEETQTVDCRDNKEFRSYFSGHTTGAFAAAGLTCMHHAYLPLYGGGTREALTCAGAFLAASAAGLFRVMADQHFMTDVLTGAAVGTLTGLGVPWLFHYRGGALPETGRSKKGGQVSFRVIPTPMGLVGSGEF